MMQGTAPRAVEAQEVANALGDLFLETMMFHRQWARRQGLTMVQFAVLKTLLAEGPLQPSQIADHFGISRSAVSGEINALETGGWIVRTHPKGNRRTRLTSLTPHGRRVLDSATSEYRTQLARGYAGHSEEERTVLARTISALAAHLRGRREADEPARKGDR